MTAVGMPNLFSETLQTILDPVSRNVSARLFRGCQRLIIGIGLCVLVFGNVPQITGSYDGAVTVVALLVAAFFAMEYVARIWQVPLHDSTPVSLSAEHDEHARRGESTVARIRWAITPLGLVDLLAVVPIPLALLLGLPSSDARLFGIFWTLKLIRSTPAFSLLVRVIRNERQPLVSVMIGFLIVLLFAATAVYLLERDRQPEVFSSVLGAMWWTIATLTTTGYGDEVPATAIGRLLGGVVMISGIGMFALWAGILATGFSHELRRREFLKTWDLVAKVPLFHSLGAGTIAEVTRLLRPTDSAANYTVIREGQPGDCMYFIVSGEVEVRTRTPLRLGPGNFFGEMALITGEPRTATVVTTEPTALLQLDVVEFRGLAASRPDLMRVIQAEAARRSDDKIGTNAEGHSQKFPTNF